MPYDSPDWTIWQIPAIEVEGEAQPEIAATETPWGGVLRLATSSTDYVTIVTATVNAAKTGKLRLVEMASDEYTRTRFKLVIGAMTFFEDLQLPESLSLDFGDLKLAAATVVTLSAKSSDGTAIVCYGDIIGKEIG